MNNNANKTEPEGKFARTLCSDLKSNHIILIQEPYITKKGTIPCVPKSHKQFMVTQKAKGVVRSAILVPNELERKTILLNGLSNDDITTGNKYLKLQ